MSAYIVIRYIATNIVTIYYNLFRILADVAITMAPPGPESPAPKKPKLDLAESGRNTVHNKSQPG